MPRYGQTAQMVLTVPLLVGTDAKVVDGAIVGRKMSKSADNYIGLAEEPLVMFRKTMQVDDDVIFRYFELLSSRPSEEVARLRAERAAGRDPREIKALFAQEIVTRFHDADAAAAAERAFKSIYGADAVPDDVPEFKVATDGPTLSIVKALSAAGLVKSNGEGSASSSRAASRSIASASPTDSSSSIAATGTCSRRARRRGASRT